MKYISKTDIKDYSFCPFYYYLKKIKGYKVDNEQMKRGREIHKAIEIYIKERKELEGFRDQINTYKIIKGIIEEKYGHILEKHSEKKLFDNRNGFYGVIDFYFLTTSGGVVGEIKTGSYKNYKVNEYFKELYFYSHLLLMNKYDVKWMVIIFLDERRLVSRKLEWNELINHLNYFNEIKRRIESGEFPKNKNSCKYCPFSDICEKEVF